MDFATAAFIFCAAATFLHLLTAILTYWRSKRAERATRKPHAGAVTIIRPVCGLDHYDELTLRSTFSIDYPEFEIIFCSASEHDAAVPFVRGLIAAHPHIKAKLLIGDDQTTRNPKLNNIIKGWNAARTEWIVLADSNVLIPETYIDELLANFRPDTGLVCSPPLASRPHGFWAELECAFLNTYQARWQYAADTIGFGFAQGKSMLWRRNDLSAAGGIEALGAEIAEDAAATKIVRQGGRRVRLVDRPFEQPLGVRYGKQVWDRQVRWARLRRATFAIYYVPELLTGSLLPLLAGTYAAWAHDIDPLLACAGLGVVWFGTEAALAWAAGWHMSRLSPLAWMARDLLLPLLWIEGLRANNFNWRGNSMSVSNVPAPANNRQM